MTVLVTIAVYRIPRDLLERAVRSVLAQTHTDLQIVVMGDGEPVDLDVRDERLFVHDFPDNRGPYFRQVVALATSPHEWYATMGADDWLEPEHLETLLAPRGTSASIPTYVWNGERKQRSWLGELGIVKTERLRAIGGYNPAERIGQDSLIWRLLAQQGHIATTRRATYHRTLREGSLTSAPETGIGSPARRAVIARNREILRACRGKSAEWVRQYRAGLVPGDIWRDVNDAIGQLLGVVAA